MTDTERLDALQALIDTWGKIETDGTSGRCVLTAQDTVLGGANLRECIDQLGGAAHEREDLG